MKGEAMVNTPGCASWRPPNHTRWRHSPPHGSVKLERVAKEVGICPRDYFLKSSLSRYLLYSHARHQYYSQFNDKD
jgi:hypothetical protein